MSSFTSVHSRPSVAVSSTSSWHSNRFFVAKLWRNLTREILGSYQPELHYMRGPDPRWRKKHGAVLHDGVIQLARESRRTIRERAVVDGCKATKRHPGASRGHGASEITVHRHKKIQSRFDAEFATGSNDGGM